MTPFESDGAYAGIPYRVLPDASIEALLPGGLVKFKNIDQFLASANAVPADTNLTRPIVSFDMPGVRITNVSASVQQMDYYSILVEAINNTKQNSAQLRQLVYERARFNFKRDVLFGHSSLGLSDLVQHINDFELAVTRIEANATDEPTRSENRVPEHAENLPKVTAQDDWDHPANDAAPLSPGGALQILPPQPIRPLYMGFSHAQRMDASPYDRLPEEFASYKRFTTQLVGIMIAGIAVIGIILFSGATWISSRAPPRIVA